MGKARPERQKLNREFVRLKEGQTLTVLIQGFGTKKWEEVDEKTGEFVPKEVRTLEMLSDKGIPFRMFEDGGLRANADVIEKAMAEKQWIELEHMGFEEITLKNGDPARVNKYDIYSAEAPKDLAVA